MKRNQLSENRLTIYIPNEMERKKQLSNILQYLQYDNTLFYYLFFGYEEYNKTIENYIKKYPELGKDKGFIEIEKDDATDAHFIDDVLDEYQFASLYINQIPHLDQKYDFVSIRESSSLFEGYVIKELKYGYIDIIKDDSLPAWDTVELGISPDNIWVEKSKNNWILLSEMIQAKEDALRLLNFIDQCLEENGVTSLSQNPNFEISYQDWNVCLLITSKKGIGTNPMIIIKGNHVDIYIFSNLKIITIDDIDNEVDLAILKKCILLLFFSTIRIVRRGDTYESVSFFRQRWTDSGNNQSFKQRYWSKFIHPQKERNS